MWRHRGTVLVRDSAEALRARLPSPELDIEPVDDESCLLRLGGDDLNGMATWVGFLGLDFEVLDPPELADAVRVLAERYGRAVSGR
jgi:predicted DNA-binding transcriptional regulator YafY